MPTSASSRPGCLAACAGWRTSAALSVSPTRSTLRSSKVAAIRRPDSLGAEQGAPGTTANLPCARWCRAAQGRLRPEQGFVICGGYDKDRAMRGRGHRPVSEVATKPCVRSAGHSPFFCQHNEPRGTLVPGRSNALLTAAPSRTGPCRRARPRCVANSEVAIGPLFGQSIGGQGTEVGALLGSAQLLVVTVIGLGCRLLHCGDGPPFSPDSSEWTKSP